MGFLVAYFYNAVLNCPAISRILDIALPWRICIFAGQHPMHIPQIPSLTTSCAPMAVLASNIISPFSISVHGAIVIICTPSMQGQMCCIMPARVGERTSAWVTSLTSSTTSPRIMLAEAGHAGTSGKRASLVQLRHKAGKLR